MKKLMAVLISLALLCATALPALAEGPVKDETVYILSEPDGTARKIIVSDWLSNPVGETRLADESLLTEIENLKSDETLTGGFWLADGKDVYYQGESAEPLPVEVKITYWLDEQEIAPDDLAGQSGRVRIRFDYTVFQSSFAEIDGQTETITAPYAVITGALLENDVFSNIQTVNARLINDGDHSFVVGAALPGLQDSLKLDREIFELPEFIEIEADVTDFALPMTVTLATSEVFASLDSDSLNDAEALKSAVNTLTDGIAQLMNGSAQLCDGLTELSDGADQLSGGLKELSNGLNALVANNELLLSGSTQVFETLLTAANQQLAAADADIPELTVENYSETLAALIDAMSEDGVTLQARAQVEQAVRAQEETIRAAVTQAVLPEVQAQVEAAVQENVLEQALAALDMTAETYAAAKESGQLPKAQAEQIEGAVAQQMASDEIQETIAQQTKAQMASDDVQALVDQKTEEQLQALIDQNMSGDEVQTQIAQTVAQYQETCASLTALKEQLDSYNSFHTGLIAYTEGASAAADGAVQLKDGMTALQEGVAQLTEGAQAMKDGLEGFTLDGIDLEALLARARALIDTAKAHQNYSGLADGTIGKVRYIWRTDAIEP